MGIATGGMAVASHPDTSDKVISVAGSAMASTEPDLVTVRFGVETQKPTSSEALPANADLMAKVVHALQLAGIDKDEISTSRFNIQAVYDSQQDKASGRRTQVLAGYRVSNMIAVETAKLDLVASIIDSAVASGVNRVDGVQFTLSPGVLAELKDQLIERAVLDARSKAEKALAPLGYVITGVRDMSLSDFSAPAPMYADTARVEMMHSAPTQIFASDQDVRTAVQVTFLIGKLAN
jgi:uncharacterized protein YggE